MTRPSPELVALSAANVKLTELVLAMDGIAKAAVAGDIEAVKRAVPAIYLDEAKRQAGMWSPPGWGRGGGLPRDQSIVSKRGYR